MRLSTRALSSPPSGTSRISSAATATRLVFVSPVIRQQNRLSPSRYSAGPPRIIATPTPPGASWGAAISRSLATAVAMMPATIGRWAYV